MAGASGTVERLLSWCRVDFRPPRRQPKALALVVATVVSLGGSLGVDAALVAIGTAVFPSTRNFGHFHLDDYGTLTVIGVLVACAAWPITTRISSSPRWLFLRMAVAVTLVLWLPDLWILHLHESPKGVAVLMTMHLAIALVTYNALVRIAPAGELATPQPVPVPGETARAAGAIVNAGPAPRLVERRAAWAAMLGLVAVELAAGVLVLLGTPTSRPSGVIPTKGAALYLVHAVLGAVLAFAAVAFLQATIRSSRPLRICAAVGLCGLALAGGGGILTVSHGLRVLGMVVMLVGGFLAALGYIMPAISVPAEAGDAGGTGEVEAALQAGEVGVVEEAGLGSTASPEPVPES